MSVRSWENERHPQARSDAQTVIVIEDDPVIVELISNIVAMLGFTVESAENAAAALDLFERCSNSVFCVIMDYGIPGMDPSRLIARIREIRNDTEVLLSSGYNKSFIDKEFSLASVSGFIPKPYEPQRLIDELNKLARNRAPSA